jgi:hypothetical protein
MVVRKWLILDSAGQWQGRPVAMTKAQPKNGSWMHLPALLLGCQARRDDAAGSCLQGEATPHGAPKAVLASA